MSRVTIDALLERKARILKDGMHPINLGQFKKEDKVTELIEESKNTLSLREIT